EVHHELARHDGGPRLGPALGHFVEEGNLAAHGQLHDLLEALVVCNRAVLAEAEGAGVDEVGYAGRAGGGDGGAAVAGLLGVVGEGGAEVEEGGGAAAHGGGDGGLVVVVAPEEGHAGQGRDGPGSGGGGVAG